MTVAILIDLMLAGLLVATIVYAAVLNRRLAFLRNGREELTKVVEQLNLSTAQAAVAIEQLKRTAADTGGTLQATINQARTAAEELGFLVERGERAADRVEGAVRASRQPEPAPGRPSAPRAAPLRAIRDEPAEALAATGTEAANPVRQSLLKAIEKMR